MKTFLTFINISLLVHFCGMAQITDNANLGNQSLNTLNTKIRASFSKTAPTNKIDRKEELLFKNWINNALVVIDSKAYRLSEVNFNIQRKKFITRIGNDSLFFLKSDSFDEIVVSNKVFKPFGIGNNDLYEVIYEGVEFSILKDYYLSVMEKSNDIMMDRSKDDIRQKSRYLLYRDGKTEVIRLRRKNILALIKKEKINAIEEFMKKNGLSFKKESDLHQIMKYHDSL